MNQKMLDSLYGPKFFLRRASLAWRVPIVAGAIMFALKDHVVRNIIDFGCGNGDILYGLKAHGMLVQGVECTEAARQGSMLLDEELLIHDLSKPLTLPRKYHLGICMEVAEHLPEKSADILLDTLTKHCGIILFGAAPPGQLGGGHINMKPMRWWESRIAECGYIRDSVLTARWLHYLTPYATKKGIKAFYNNAVFYTQKGW